MRLINVLCFAAIFSGAGWADDPPKYPAPDPPPCNSYPMKNDATLSSRQKFCFFTGKLATGPALFGAAWSAGFDIMQHKPREWPLGAEGFGRRFGTKYAQGMTKSTAEYLAGWANREDPRAAPPEAGTHTHTYPRGAVGKRIGHALLSTAWTHRDSGKDGIAVSHFAGAFASGWVGNLWEPDSSNYVQKSMVRTGKAFGSYAVSALWEEFQPDVIGWVGKMFIAKTPKPTKSDTKPKK